MTESPGSSGSLTLSALQRMILQMYGQKDAARGDAATFLWLTEEFGELATALRSGTRDELAAEMADVLAWLATLANIRGIELEEAVMRKYGRAVRTASPSLAFATRPKNPDRSELLHCATARHLYSPPRGKSFYGELLILNP